MKEFKFKISNENIYEERLWEKIFHSIYLSYNIGKDILYGEVLKKEEYSPDNLTRNEIKYKNIGFKITDISTDKNTDNIYVSIIPGGPLEKATLSILENSENIECFKFAPRFISDNGYYTILTIDLVLLDENLYQYLENKEN